jgi:hypothetical protein
VLSVAPSGQFAALAHARTVLDACASQDDAAEARRSALFGRKTKAARELNFTVDFPSGGQPRDRKLEVGAE